MKQMLKMYFPALPLLYLVMTIFLLRTHIGYFYLASIVLLLATIWMFKGVKASADVFLARLLLVLAAIGLAAAVILSIEKVELLMNPQYVTSCSLSPIVACSPVITSEQASAFGFPNPFIGIFGFSAVLAGAMTILAGAQKLHKAWWRTLWGGTVFGALFSAWLMQQALFNIGKLCLYCMAVWLVSWAMFWLVLERGVQNKSINLGVKLNKLTSYKYELITISYFVILALIFYRWSNYWIGLI